jgi:3-isopropylmalate/(R)-2-methylmalate dehydratase small subunit
VVSTRIADIFRNNALKNGLVPVIVPADVHAELLQSPGAELTVDVDARTLTMPDGRLVEFPLDGFSRHCLMEGIDQLGFLLSQADAIAEFERDRPWQP